MYQTLIFRTTMGASAPAVLNWKRKTDSNLCAIKSDPKNDVACHWNDVVQLYYSYFRAQDIPKRDACTRNCPPGLSYTDLTEKRRLFTGIKLEASLIFWDALLYGDRNCKIRIELWRPNLLTLTKFRLISFLTDLALRFKNSVPSASIILNSTVEVLASDVDELIMWLPVDNIKATMPQSFESLYSKTTINTHCKEMFSHYPKKYMTKCLTYSDHKSHNTTKFLIGRAPNSAWR